MTGKRTVGCLSWILVPLRMLPIVICQLVVFCLLKHFYGTQEGGIAVLAALAAGGIGIGISLLIEKLVFGRQDRGA